MKFDTDALDLMQDVIKLAPRTGLDRYNRPAYGDDVSYRCYITNKPVEIRTVAGQELVARSTVRVAPVVVNNDDTLTELDELPDIEPSHRITFPDGEQPVILDVIKNTGDESLKHVVIHT